MLQRLQSVLLFLLSLCMLGSSYFPLWEKVGPTGEKYILKTYGVVHYFSDQSVEYLPWPYAVIAVLTVVVAVIALFEIFQYKNRLLQIKLGALNSLLMTVTLGGSAILGSRLDGRVLEGVYGSYKMGIGVLMAAMVFNIIANRFIRRDENLVRDADRIR